jgi:hypothetical protein
MEQTFGDGNWTLQRGGEPFAQRFTAMFGEDGRTITGPVAARRGRSAVRDDFDLVYRRIDG